MSAALPLSIASFPPPSEASLERAGETISCDHVFFRYSRKTDWVIRDYASFNSTTTFGNPATTPGPCDYRDINTYGTPVSGALTSGSCLNSGYRVNAYKFFAAAGSRIQIVMRSADFYTHQALFGPAGNNLAWAAEDWDDGQTVVSITAPVTGTYHLLAASNNPSTGGPGALGNYTLEVRVF